jgi:hypothetical protein
MVGQPLTTPVLPLSHPRPERWPQVSLRGLLVIVTLAAALTWWIPAEYQRWQRIQQAIWLWERLPGSDPSGGNDSLLHDVPMHLLPKHGREPGLPPPR